jgi:serine/threonine protein kinase
MAEIRPDTTVNYVYRILRLLGEGGMNRVYLVEHVDTGVQWQSRHGRDPELDRRWIQGGTSGIEV